MTFRKFIHAVVLILVGAVIMGLAILYQVSRISKHEDERYKQTTTIVEQRI